MSEPKTSTCIYCRRKIIKAKVPSREGGRLWRWQTVTGHFYCPYAGGECWHEPVGKR